MTVAGTGPHRDGTLTGDIGGSGGFLWFPANLFIASAAGPVLEVQDAIHNGFLLDGTAAESVSVSFMCPYNWNAVLPIYYGYNAGAGAGGVVLGIYLEDIIDGYNITTETPTPVADVTFAAGAQQVMQVKPSIVKQYVNAGEVNSLKVGRLPVDAGDTLANDWGLIGVKLVRAG